MYELCTLGWRLFGNSSFLLLQFYVFRISFSLLWGACDCTFEWVFAIVIVRNASSIVHVKEYGLQTKDDDALVCWFIVMPCSHRVYSNQKCVFWLKRHRWISVNSWRTLYFILLHWCPFRNRLNIRMRTNASKDEGYTLQWSKWFHFAITLYYNLIIENYSICRWLWCKM